MKPTEDESISQSLQTAERQLIEELRRKGHFFDVAKEWETFVNFLKSDRQAARVPFLRGIFP